VHRAQRGLSFLEHLAHARHGVAKLIAELS
jgi:hypothetical protein